MKKLDKFDYFMVTAVLNLKGFEFKEESSFGTEIWYNHTTNKSFMINKHLKKISKEDLLKMLNQAGMSVDEFLELI